MLMEEGPRKVNREEAGCSVYSSTSQPVRVQYLTSLITNVVMGGRAVTDMSVNLVTCVAVQVILVNLSSMSVCVQNNANKSLR